MQHIRFFTNWTELFCLWTVSNVYEWFNTHDILCILPSANFLRQFHTLVSIPGIVLNEFRRGFFSFSLILFITTFTHRFCMSHKEQNIELLIRYILYLIRSKVIRCSMLSCVSQLHSVYMTTFSQKLNLHCSGLIFFKSSTLGILVKGLHGSAAIRPVYPISCNLFLFTDSLTAKQNKHQG